MEWQRGVHHRSSLRLAHRDQRLVDDASPVLTSITPIPRRWFQTIPSRPASHPPSRSDRGPPSQEDTQTDFAKLDVLGGTPPPATAIDACLPDGFIIGNGLRLSNGSGCLLINGEVAEWRPWEGGSRTRLLNEQGQWECDPAAWGVLSLVWPKPDLLILGLGASMHPLSPATRTYLSTLGVRTEIQDTRNAAAQFNLLATERGVGEVAAALIPIGRSS
ncbi:MAG: pre-mRNA-splicing factor 8 [Watsoniomyces obsoletus]|nr:MAG: pre-mRNA-splicing factor 8 [Watsoniomyces obsoletus]